MEWHFFVAYHFALMATGRSRVEGAFGGQLVQISWRIVIETRDAGAELWAGLDGPGPAHIDSWPAQSEIKK